MLAAYGEFGAYGVSSVKGDPLGLSVPTLTEMKLNGAYAEGVEGIYPTVTYPAHTTLITGVRPALHGIYQNRIFEAPTDEQTGEWYWFSKDLKTETLWSMAKRAELVTANVGWPTLTRLVPPTAITYGDDAG